MIEEVKAAVNSGMVHHKHIEWLITQWLDATETIASLTHLAKEAEARRLPQAEEIIEMNKITKEYWERSNDEAT